MAVGSTTKPTPGQGQRVSSKLFCIGVLCSFLLALSTRGGQIPDWCKPLPRPEYKSLGRVSISDPWFEVYKVAPSTLAIYEPHQSEETIGYLILGHDKAILHLAFPTGNRYGRLRQINRPPRCTCPPGENRYRRAQHSGRCSLRPPRPGHSFRRPPRRQSLL